MQNKVSISIIPQDLIDITAHFTNSAAILKKYLITLSAEDRHSLPKMGDKTFAFVTKALEYSASNPDFIPVFVDGEEWATDVAAHQQLTGLYRICQQICSDIDDSAMLCGSEAYTAALSYYNGVRQGVKMDIASSKPIFEDLAARFPGRPVKNKTI